MQGEVSGSGARCVSLAGVFSGERQTPADERLHTPHRPAAAGSGGTPGGRARERQAAVGYRKLRTLLWVWATLQLWNMSLSLSGNTLRVTLELPVHRGKDSTLAYEDLHPGGWSKYRVYVRRVSDNTEQVLVESNRTFELPLLSWGERYCLSVEPHLPSRPNPAKRTEEQCISTPPPEGGAWATAILSSALLSLVALGTLAAAWVRARVKKPMETPSVLKSFRKQTSPWLRSEPWTLGMSGGDPCSDVESIHPIPLGLKAHPHPYPARASHSGRAACRVPEQVMCWTPEAVPSSKAGGPRLRDRTDGSGCSTDSGICLQDPPGSHSLLPPTGPQGGRGGQSPGSSKEGCGLEPEEEGLPLGPPAPEAPPVGLDTGEALAQAVPPHARVSRGQRQAGGPGEALGSSGCPPGPEGVAKPVLASGYLKQASVAVLPSPGAQGADAPEASWGPPMGSARLGRRLSLSSLAPGGLEPLPCLPPESPKALLASGFLGQEPAWPSAHLSLLCASAHLSLSFPRCRV
ncbi:PREDICTED: interleukin-10 receptor subunit alpha [Gekko japonicus]|uniref:Interleukin-10 receptor subunit alpha n=1 Tax=Gekko japonicus TaxID=146911 RepID=A0ABM1KKM2_GEKJA|nr:PREDICTED: interleukin-10 receptor subunit alpha [Gekko japonicus]